jgi:hypothetical protein
MKLKINNIVAVVLIAVFSVSCGVSTRVPTKEKSAGKKLSKHLKGIRNIVTEFPELMDSLKTTVHDTIYIPQHSIDTFTEIVVDTFLIDSILNTLLSSQVERSLMLEDLPTIPRRQAIATARNLLIKEILKDTSTVYEDSIIKATYGIAEGKLFISVTAKEKEVSYVREEIIVNPTVTVKRDWVFWVILLLLLYSVYKHIHTYRK